MTDIKALIEQLQDLARRQAFALPNEAADALEAESIANTVLHIKNLKLEAELADEKRKREEAEAEVKRVRGYWSESGDQIVQWRIQFEAAREVAIEYCDPNIVDYEIEAKLKQHEIEKTSCNECAYLLKKFEAARDIAILAMASECGTCFNTTAKHCERKFDAEIEAELKENK